MTFRHTESTKNRIRDGVAKAHQRAIAERGCYISEDGMQSIKDKLLDRMTADRRKQLSSNTQKSRQKANQARQHVADDFALRFRAIIIEMQQDDNNLKEIARKLNAAGHTARRGGPWTDQTVRQILKRIKPQRGLKSEVIDTLTSGTRRMIGWRHED